MAKFYGEIGFAFTEENKDRPGVWTPTMEKRTYYGELIRNTRRLQGSDVNDDVAMNNEISILADPFANQNFRAMRYVKYMGTKWKIVNVEVAYPRLILTIGGVYNVEK
ncbi:hypothetical protein [Anaerostipes sp. PC18]|uniref:DUF7253 family protein n=1 Tax=Anaerostipes sp. PC18 TaxID=3036926 RepID=UPI00308C65BB|nr:hypothetical protein P8F77_10170 [Anaerostipes sp. PC18]